MKAAAFFLWRRSLEAFLTLAGLVLLTFLLLKALPGGPFDAESSFHPLVKQNLESQWRVQGPATGQLLSYAASVFRGDLGWSLSQPGRKVSDILKTGFAQTIWLNLAALVAVLAFGLVFAFGGFLGDERGWGAFLDSFLIALISLPGLFLGPLLIWIFSFELNWFPAAFLESPWHYVLPVLTLSLRPGASLARLLLGALRESRTADYLRTAKAKGLSPARIFWKHALKNSLIPVLAYAGPVIVGILSGSFLVEVLFSTRGLGVVFVEALAERDFTVILGLTLIYGALLVLVSFTIDVLSRWLDPRVEESP